MGELNDKAKKVFQLKYAKSKSKTWKETCERVANHVSSVEEKDIESWKQKFFDMIYDFKFIPGGRVLANSGTGIPSLANCFVLGLDDSRESIYGTLKDAAEVFAHGGGIGYSLSKIREEGAEIKTTGGKASGPLSFLTLFDQTGEVISQASRRGAQIGLLDIDHPDIENFIHFKSTPNHRNERLLLEYDRNLHRLINGSLNGTKYYDVLRKTLLDDQLTHFNVSVAITDKFMEAVFFDEDWELISPSTGEVVKKIKAKDLLKMIADQCWESGDPGVLFTDRINQDNLVHYHGYIKATNPCFFPDTLIETINGRIKIKDITEPTYVYTMDKNKKLSIRKASASWITRKNAQTVVIKFNNGKQLIVTPEHKIFTKKYGYVEARNLKFGDEVIILNRARRGAKYSGVKLSSEPNRSYRMEHRFIIENMYQRDLTNYDVHHKDGNTFNNSINNLEIMPHAEHARLTAKTQPNNHQVVGIHSKFISGPNSKHGEKTIVHLPKEITSDAIGQTRVIEILEGPISDVYDISVEETNNLIADFVVCHNCGEVPLFPGESCILGSLNLHSFYDKKIKNINWDGLKDVIKSSTRFLEDVTEISVAPVDFINQVTKSLRRLGLGVMGFADLLVDLNIPYDSQEAIELAQKLSWFISYHAWITSYELAKERGTFSLYDGDKIDLHIVEKTLYNNPYETFEIPLEEVKKVGFRNVSVTSIAPTGSIAIIGGVNSGIEPFFALAYTRYITEGVGNIAKDQITEINPALESKLKEHGYTEEQIQEIVECAVKNGTLSSCELIDDSMKNIFKTADEIDWKSHIHIQEAWQKYISNSISKTINCKEETTPEDIYEMYMYMWTHDLKGGTIYRNNSKTFQILEKPKE